MPVIFKFSTNPIWERWLPRSQTVEQGSFHRVVKRVSSLFGIKELIKHVRTINGLGGRKENAFPGPIPNEVTQRGAGRVGLSDITPAVGRGDPGGDGEASKRAGKKRCDAMISHRMFRVLVMLPGWASPERLGKFEPLI